MEQTQRKIMYIAISVFCIFAVLAAVVEQVSLSSVGKNNTVKNEEVAQVTQEDLKKDFNAMK